MNEELKKMYQKIVMKNYRHPSNFGIAPNMLTSEFKNSSCGDEAIIGFTIYDNKLMDIKQEVIGCSICKASASVLTKVLLGKTITEALELIAQFKKLVYGPPLPNKESLGEAAYFSGVKEFPARRNCAMLAWKALEIGLLREIN